MKRFTLTAGLNIKFVGIISMFMILITCYGQWISMEEKKTAYIGQLEGITGYLAGRIPPSALNKSERMTEGQSSPANEYIQQSLKDIFIPSKFIKYGVFSVERQRIVAIGPDLDASLLTVDPAFWRASHIGDMPHLIEQYNAVIWYGSHSICHLRPLYNDQGEVIAYAFASLNMDKVEAEQWVITLKNLAGGLIGLLIVIMLFHEILIEFRRELQDFAGAVLEGRGQQFESRIPEFTPVLRYISEQAENLTRLDRLNIIGEMAASIGHEVRNPMTTVRGFLQFLSKKEIFSGCREQFALMISEMDRANQIITEFLSLSKNKAMDFKMCQLNDLITEITPLLQADVLRCNCQLVLSLAVIPPVRIDANSMRQLILNLVRNAIEATAERGKITIETTFQEQRVFLTIKDEGIGIPPEVVGKLGTPFFTTKENGTGLGLAVCYRIVERHGASIDVDSEPGKGTRFTIGLHCTGLDKTGGEESC